MSHYFLIKNINTVKYIKTFEALEIEQPVNLLLISYDDIVKLSNDSFMELEDIGYTIKTNKIDRSFLGYMFVQIFKQSKRSHNQHFDNPYNFIDIKDDVLSFHDRLKEYNANIVYSFVYENDEGGYSLDRPTYEDFEMGVYDKREVSIFTIYIK